MPAVLGAPSMLDSPGSGQLVGLGGCRTPTVLVPFASLRNGGAGCGVGGEEEARGGALRRAVTSSQDGGERVKELFPLSGYR
jgi:hypothetical protein